MKFFISALLAVVILNGHAAIEDGPPKIFAQSAILFDVNSGRVLFKKNENEKRPVASTQKILTALLVVEKGGLDEEITITKSDQNAEPTKLYLQAGHRYKRSSLVEALMVKSANDVARALARDVGGSQEGFSALMNAKARELGATNSNFKNPNGLPAEGQYSTARDMAHIAKAAYKNPALRQIMTIRELDFQHAGGRTQKLINTNRVLRNYLFCNGMKTGYTIKSGHCLVASGSWNGREVIAVVLGSNKANVWKDTASLLAFGLNIDLNDAGLKRGNTTPVATAKTP